MAFDNPKKVGQATISFEAEGIVEISDFLKELELNISALPQGYQDECEYTGSIIVDDYGNKILNHKYKKVSSDIVWWSECSFTMKKTLMRLASLSQFPSQPNSNYKKYLKFTNITNSSTTLRLKANEIVSGSRTTLEASLRLAEWVHSNMKYDTSYKDKVMASTWVLNNLKGTCDEYSTLLISLLRSVGIPSRYVSGYVYSGGRFETHAWVEAFVDDEWVPFDPSHGEFGSLDALHIKMSHSLDGTIPLVQLKYLSKKHPEVRILDPKINITLLSTVEEDEFLGVDAQWNDNVVGTDDYVLLKVTVKNPTKHFIPTTLLMNKPKDLEFVYGYENEAVLLNPNSTTSLYFIFHTPTHVKPGYLYTYPVEITVIGGNTEMASMSLDPRKERKYSLEDLMFFVSKEQLEERHGIKINNITISPNIVYDTPPKAIVSLRNSGNTIIENLTLKLEYSDKKFDYVIGDVLINDEKNITVPLKLPQQKGNIVVKFSFVTDEILLSTQRSFVSAETPKVNIEYNGPRQIVNFEDLNFNLTINFLSGNISNSSINIVLPSITDMRDIDTKNTTLNYTLPSEYLKVGENGITFFVEVIDVHGKKFIFTHSMMINRKITNPLIYIPAVVYQFFMRFLSTNLS